jgi:dTDP-glucose 4,6-dehydratase
MSFSWQLNDDLDAISEQCDGIWDELRGANILLTGGTGFIGTWLLETFRHVNISRDLGIRLTIITRSPNAFEKKHTHLFNTLGFEFVYGDVTAEWPKFKTHFTHLIHAATDASADLNENNPLKMYETIISGTKNCLEFARINKVPNVLFMSSGAVYGQQPWEMERVAETWFGGPNCVDPKATYAEAKRAAEMLCAIYCKQYGLNVTIARIFALLGPYLSLGIHFAAGNFIKDAMEGKEVVVKGNGMPIRSYMYASDLVVWLLRILVRGQSCYPYNVGSEEGVSIRALAKIISTELAAGEFSVMSQEDIGWNLGRYVPDTSRIQRDLGVSQKIDLKEAIIRTAIFNGWKGNRT